MNDGVCRSSFLAVLLLIFPCYSRTWSHGRLPCTPRSRTVLRSVDRRAEESPLASFLQPAVAPEQIAEAMRLSNLSGRNITAAAEAADLWEDIILKTSTENSSNDAGPLRDFHVQALCLALYASCLVRIGRDADALPVFEQALALPSNAPNAATLETLQIGRASSLQRLLRYREGLDQFLVASASSDLGLIGAVTCAMRLGELQYASQILDAVEISDSNVQLCEVKAIISFLLEPNLVAARFESLRSIHSSELCAWLSSANTKYRSPIPSVEQMIALNVGQWDDPLLTQLDDKVLLHRLLSGDSSTRWFWPEGFILPDDDDVLARKGNSERLWMRKTRAGYGSHGNQVCTAQQAMASCPRCDEVLLQQLVSPFLLEGSMFSLRIYVVYILANGEEARLSSVGLAKFASLPYQLDAGDASCNRRLMTNSGRDLESRQIDLVSLRSSLESKGLSHAVLFRKIEDAVQAVMKCYAQRAEDMCAVDHRMGDTRERLAILGLPKVLGFDFIVDRDLSPWLLEVNRFPGLEARDEQDSFVKRSVLREAWDLASAHRAPTRRGP